MARTEGRPRRGTNAPPPAGITSGEREPIFSHLSEEIVRNMRQPGSESSAIWNAFYPFAHAGVESRAWHGVPRLWGTPAVDPGDDRLTPYFWGLDVEGRPMDGLAAAIGAIAGRDDRLEVDLILRGQRGIVVVEAKADAEPGRCGRYLGGRCPEVHQVGEACRYWEPGAAGFWPRLDFGPRPAADLADAPPCSHHYQLGRTLLLAEHLGGALGLVPYLCLLIPRRRWPSIRSTWLDFAERVREEDAWRRLRVMAWEDLRVLVRSKGKAS